MKVLLYSGGLDSWLIDKLWKPDKKIYIDIQGDYNESEKDNLPDDVEIISCPLLGTFEDETTKFLPLRNLYFLMIASHYGDEICLGATAGDWGNKDKTPEFLIKTEDMLNYLWTDKKTNRTIKVNQDFVYRSKDELIREYLHNGGTIDDIKNATFSCYTPVNGKECFDCYPCFRKFALLYANGYKYSQEEKEKMWDYVKRKIIPTKEEGGYAGTYYTERGEESKALIYTVDSLRREFGHGKNR